jgi:hypothetical protein
LNEQRQLFARTIRLQQNWVSHTCWLNTCPGDYDNHASDLHQHSGVAQMRVLDGLMWRPVITTSIIYRILEAQADHTKQLTENWGT